MRTFEYIATADAQAPWYLFDLNIDGMYAISIAGPIDSRYPYVGEILCIKNVKEQQYIRVIGIESSEDRVFMYLRWPFFGRLKWLSRLIRIEPKIIEKTMRVQTVRIADPLRHRFDGDSFPFPPNNEKLFTCSISDT